MSQGKDARRIVITGIGVVSPGALSSDGFWAALLEAKALAQAPSPRELRRLAPARPEVESVRALLWQHLSKAGFDTGQQEGPLLADRHWVTPSQFAPEPVNLSARDVWDPLSQTLPLGLLSARLSTASLNASLASASASLSASLALFAALCRPFAPHQAWYLRLRALWRRAAPGRILVTLVLLIRFGRLWTQFRPARPPGRLAAAGRHTTRGPDVSRMTQSLVIRG